MGFLDFARAGGEGGDIATPLIQEHDGHVAQAANAEHAHAVGGLHVVHDGGKYRDAAAQQRAGLGGVYALRNGHRPHPMAAHLLRKGPVPPHDGGLQGGAHLLVAVQAGLAVQAAAGAPAHAHALADFEAFLGRYVAQAHDAADGFVAGHEGIGRDAPLVVEHREVGVADAAVLHGNVYFFGT